MLSKPKTLIWDWNGTMLDDMDICVASINQLLAKRQLPLMDLLKYRSLFDFPVIRYYEAIGFDFKKEAYDEVAIEFISVYLDMLQQAKLFPGVASTLAHFRQEGLQQAILSAMEQNKLEHSVQWMGIDHFFHLVKGSNDHFAAGKKHQAETILGLLGSTPGETLLIGDTLHDMEVADHIGCRCILVAAGHQSRERLMQQDRHRVIDRLEQLIGLI